MLVRQLQAFLGDTNCLDPSQSSFRPGYRIEMVLVNLTDDPLQEMDKRSANLLIILDLSETFRSIYLGIFLKCFWESESPFCNVLDPTWISENGAGGLLQSPHLWGPARFHP